MFYNWRSKFGDMDASLTSQLKELQDENRRLKKMYAEAQLSADVLKEAMSKKVGPSQCGEMAKWASRPRAHSIRHACRTFALSGTCCRYQAKASEENASIAVWLVLPVPAQRVKGFGWNHKRIYRIHRALEVNLRIKPKKRLLREKPGPLAVPETINHVWSMDSMCNQLSDGRSFCLFNVLAMDRQPRAPQHSTWRDYPNSKTGTHRLAPLLAAAKKCGITLSEDCLVSSLRMIKKALRGGDEMPHGQRK